MSENIKEKSLITKLGESQDAPPWGLGEMGLAIVVLFVSILIIGTSVTAIASPSAINPEPISFVLGWLIGLVVVFIYIVVRWRRIKSNFDALRLQMGYWNPFLAIMVGLGGAFTASLIAGLGSGDFLAPIQVLGVDDSNLGSLFLVGLFVLIVQPIAENLVFEAVSLPRLRATLGAWFGLLATIALYAIYYYLVFGSRAADTNIAIWYGIIYPLIVALTLGAVRIWSKSTLTSILAQVGVGVSIIVIMLMT